MPDIEDYAFLSDSQGAALVSREGDVEWLCLPRFDSPSVFARLLDPDAGHWSLGPAAPGAGTRRYLEDTLVLETVHRLPEGEAVVLDALLLGMGERGHEIGSSSPHVLVRQVQGRKGSVPMKLAYAPRPEYGLTSPRLTRVPEGVRAVGGPVALTLLAPVALDLLDDQANAEFTVREGDVLTFALVCSPAYGRNQQPPAFAKPEAALGDTIAAWRSWSELHNNYDGLHRGLVRTSSLVLQGLTYQPSGAVVAAATTSLPERIGGEWNWDYRFCWLRDASLMMRALWVAACPDEPERLFRFVEQAGGRLGSDAVQIMYGVEGERRLLEGKLGHMRGFADSRPVRTGNAAWEQKQLDVLGEVLDAAYVLREKLGEFEEGTRQLLTALADRAAVSWQDPDAGMWEARDRERHYLSSKVMCWVALDRAIALADRLRADDSRRGEWASARDQVKKSVLKNGWNEDVGAYVGAYGSDQLDASVLLMPLFGFLPATDPRMRSTIEVIDRDLNDEGFVRRWSEEENGFLISSYWLVQCLTMAGEVERAERLFDQVGGAASDLGLLAEMADPRTGRMLGNYPQAFSHVGLINAAWRLSVAMGRGQS